MKRYLKTWEGHPDEMVEAELYPNGGAIVIDHCTCAVHPGHWVVRRAAQSNGDPPVPEWYQVDPELFALHYRPI